MSALALDPRQRAMLEEMGVKVWFPPRAVAEPVAQVGDDRAVSASESDVATSRMDARRTAQHEEPTRTVATRSPVAAPAPAARPAPSPPAPARPAAAVVGEAVQIEPPQRLYGGSAAQGGWLIVADMLPEPDGRHGEPFAGDAGRLLENMLRALQLNTGATPVHLMRTHRGTTSSASSSQPFEQSFDAHAATVAPRMVLAMGPLAAQSLLQRNEPLGKLRGRVAELAGKTGVQVVATYHPAYLLRNPADKARAWADLCLAAAQVD